jgi:hypothetical protein
VLLIVNFSSLSGTVAIIGTVTSINISSIVFTQGGTAIHTISSNIPSVDSDNTWTLANDNTWTSKLTQLLTVITPLLVMLSLSNPVSTKSNVG